ncbi:MAG TPA: RimK family alpha-L-glutamate ligase [Firmicutes bacterium]|nr:RimK family alpha-L-glutamate ligase [Bacillota bacterium]HAW99555.1 RimK family alpha-L-glutamate ligase [Bacillota bacterium]
MKCLIIVNGYNYSLSQVYKVRRLKEEFSKYNVEVIEKSTIDITSSFEDGKMCVKDIEQYSFCIFLDKDKYLSYAIEKYIPLINNAKAIEVCDDKMLTYTFLNNLGIKTPKTIPAPLCYDPDPDPEYLIKWVKKVESELSFPIVVKECYGSLGKQVYLAKNHKELYNIAHDLIHVPHVYQEFISSSKGHDVRMFTVGGKLVAAMERINPNDFRSNIALGGHGTKFVPSKDFIDMAEKVSKAISLDYAGIDIMFGPNYEPILTEVNSNAFFTEIEKVSGVNITKLLVEHILSKYN